MSHESSGKKFMLFEQDGELFLCCYEKRAVRERYCSVGLDHFLTQKLRPIVKHCSEAVDESFHVLKPPNFTS